MLITWLRLTVQVGDDRCTYEQMACSVRKLLKVWLLEVCGVWETVGESVGGRGCDCKLIFIKRSLLPGRTLSAFLRLSHLKSVTACERVRETGRVFPRPPQQRRPQGGLDRDRGQEQPLSPSPNGEWQGRERLFLGFPAHLPALPSASRDGLCSSGDKGLHAFSSLLAVLEQGPVLSRYLISPLSLSRRRCCPWETFV